MPKKNRRSLVKPVNTPHHSLSPSSRRHDGSQRATSSEEQSPSVNDLISHLRRTQLPPSEQNASSSRSYISPRSVHPSLRNLLELPETPPPRPRLNPRHAAIGRRPLRPIPGPPPPQSWVSGDTGESDLGEYEDATSLEKVIYRLKRLPGVTFPGETDLMHVVLKSMAWNWNWHLKYDGPFLSQLPSHIKTVLLSYIALYARRQPLGRRMRGLRPLFLTDAEMLQLSGNDLAASAPDDLTNVDGDIRRLDLSCGLGHWFDFKQLRNELVLPMKTKGPEIVPSSWDEEETTPVTPVPRSLDHRLRFKNLRYLSLAHPHPQYASWNSLLQLLEHLSVITHLSLAYWPVPTRTFNSSTGQSRLPQRMPFGPRLIHGTDIYSAQENNWAESAGILRQLSRFTYCLKWLDLEGCDWLPALIYQEDSKVKHVEVSEVDTPTTNLRDLRGTDPDGLEYRHCGPEWNGSWRDIESIALGPGWDCPPAPVLDQIEPSPGSPERSLGSSVHAPLEGSDVVPWDVEQERILYRHKKARQEWCAAVIGAHRVSRKIQEIRKCGRGKWIHALAAEGVPLPDLAETELLSQE